MTEFSAFDRRFQVRIVSVVAGTVFFSVLNGTMFNVAIPDIRQQFALTPAAVSWVLTGYIVVFALAAVTYGKLADSYPLRRLMTVGLLLFNAGALLGFLSDSYPMLVGARLLQASGGGAIPALSMLVATRYFLPELRGRVLGTVASTVAFAAGVGPVVGGFIAGFFHWRYLFLISLATLVSLIVLRRLLPPEPVRDAGFDLPGAALLAAAVGLLLVFVAQGMFWALPAGLFFALFFLRHVRRAARPFVQPALFGNALYRYGLLTTFVAVGPIFGMFLTVPLMLRSLFGLSTMDIGLVIFPGALSAALLGILGGRLADRRGSVMVVFLGLALLLAGFSLLAAFSHLAPWPVILILIICYTGFAFIQASLAKAVSTTLPPAQTGVGMGIYNLVFFTAGAFGAALAGKLLEMLVLFDTGRLGPAEPLHFRGVFLINALTVLIAAGLFFFSFRRQAGPDRDRSAF